MPMIGNFIVLGVACLLAGFSLGVLYARMLYGPAKAKRYIHDDYWDDIHGPGIDYAEGERCHAPTCWCQRGES